MVLIDKKYFASDDDKFLFWLEDGWIRFEKFSIIYGNLPSWIRRFYYNEFRRLPVLNFRSVKTKSEWGE